MSKTPIFIFARKHLLYFCNLYVSKNILISVFEPFPILFKQGIDTERVIILYYLFFLCRLLTLNTIFKVIRLSGTSPKPYFLIYFIYSEL